MAASIPPRPWDSQMLGATSWLLPGGAERAFRGVVHAASERQWVKLQVDSELRPPRDRLTYH